MADAVLLSDGDLPALVAAQLIAEEERSPGAQGSGRIAIWVERSTPDGDQGELAIAAARALAELLEAEVIGSSEPGEAISPMLLHAARAAAAAGAGRLVWPQAVNADLDEMSRDADRALLISRLIALEPELGAAAGAGRFEVQAPLLDLSDVQVAQLAIDLDVPIWRCWWWSIARGEAKATEQAVDEALASAARDLARRWTTALRSAGWAEDIELASITSG